MDMVASGDRPHGSETLQLLLRQLATTARLFPGPEKARRHTRPSHTHPDADGGPSPTSALPPRRSPAEERPPRDARDRPITIALELSTSVTYARSSSAQARSLGAPRTARGTRPSTTSTACACPDGRVPHSTPRNDRGTRTQSPGDNYSVSVGMSVQLDGRRRGAMRS